MSRYPDEAEQTFVPNQRVRPQQGAANIRSTRRGADDSLIPSAKVSQRKTTTARPASAPKNRPPALTGAEKASIAERRKPEVLMSGPWIPADHPRNSVDPRKSMLPGPDLPPFWSTSKHGKPFVKREASEPGGVQTAGDDRRHRVDAKLPRGHWTRQSKMGDTKAAKSSQRKSAKDLIMDARRSLNSSAGSVHDRRKWMDMLPQGERLHMLKNSQERGPLAPDALPWTQSIDPQLTADAWQCDQERTIRQAVQSLEQILRDHLDRVVAAECQLAQAPCTNAEMVLARAFKRVDPFNSGVIDLQSFLVVWHMELQLAEAVSKELLLSGDVGANMRTCFMCAGSPAFTRCTAGCALIQHHCHPPHPRSCSLPFAVHQNPLPVEDARASLAEAVADPGELALSPGNLQ
ncbi:hypothetical protein CYMTET_5694 [Cymbomonas tetramitiformis]|uniref:Uncharacterized protein n=1 Tax=Cymbomonas tetramitiformis TaxID=36881 RepID=A0AAE0GYM9_9CHLO|nr:hypothetical protein CYMTET_5694 [Cymbomonas tetramitiformis]